MSHNGGGKSFVLPRQSARVWRRGCGVAGDHPWGNRHGIRARSGVGERRGVAKERGALEGGK